MVNDLSLKKTNSVFHESLRSINEGEILENKDEITYSINIVSQDLFIKIFYKFQYGKDYIMEDSGYGYQILTERPNDKKCIVFGSHGPQIVLSELHKIDSINFDGYTIKSDEIVNKINSICTSTKISIKKEGILKEIIDLILESHNEYENMM